MSKNTKLNERLSNREYWQTMNLAELLEKDSKCDLCQRIIQDHTLLELYVCLQEISKSHSVLLKDTLHSKGEIHEEMMMIEKM